MKRHLALRCFTLLAPLALLLSSCSRDETHFLDCGRGTSVEVDKTTYCAYTADLVAELGEQFECPENTESQFDVEGSVICAPVSKELLSDVPAEVCEAVQVSGCAAREVDGVTGGDELVALAKRLCNARCDSVERCDRPSNEEAFCGDALASCLDRSQAAPEMNIHYEMEWFPSYVTCFESNCGSDDACSVEAIRGVYPEYAQDPDMLACLDRNKECRETPEQGSRFSSDYCTSFLLARPETVESIKQCLELPCSRISECIDNLAATKAIDAIFDY